MKNSSVPSTISAFISNRLTQAFTFLTWSIFKSASLSWSLPRSHLSTFCSLKCVPPQNKGIPNHSPSILEYTVPLVQPRLHSILMATWSHQHFQLFLSLSLLLNSVSPRVRYGFLMQDTGLALFTFPLVWKSLLKWGLRAAGEPPPQERFELGEGKSSADEEPASSTMLCSWDYSEPCFPELKLWGVDFSAQTHLCSAWTRWMLETSLQQHLCQLPRQRWAPLSAVRTTLVFLKT